MAEVPWHLVLDDIGKRSEALKRNKTNADRIRVTSEYIEREAAVNAVLNLVPKVDGDGYCWVIRGDAARAIDTIPAADVRPVVVCTDCEHNNHCLTQEFVDDCGKIPLDRNTFFCADGERRSNA